MILVSSNGANRLSFRIIHSALLFANLYCGTLLADSTANCSISPPIPAVPKVARRLNPDSGSDDTASIQKAISGLQSGDWLVFEPGTYTVTGNLTVLVPGVTLYGAGATIHSTSPTGGGLWIKADNVAVYSFTLQQDSTSRQSTPWAGGISVYDDRSGGRTVRGATIENNTINSSAAVGIFVLNVENFTVANNNIWRSWADGIHLTGGAVGGRVINNTISQTGDDMISVVSYAANAAPAPAAESYGNWPSVQAGLVRNTYIAGNTASDQYWGRGISVVGGSDVTIENNKISRTPMAAAIYLTRETSFMTFGDHNILIRNNSLSQVQTMQPSYMPPNFKIAQTEQGAIELGSTIFADEFANPTWRQAFSMSDIAILNNTVEHAQFAGIRIGVGYSGSAVATASNGTKFAESWLPGQVQNITLQNDTLTDVNSTNLIEAHSGLDPGTISCSNNSLNGTTWSTKCASTITGNSVEPPVTGAYVQCTSGGSLNPTNSPAAPTLLP